MSSLFDVENLRGKDLETLEAWLEASTPISDSFNALLSEKLTDLVEIEIRIKHLRSELNKYQKCVDYIRRRRYHSTQYMQGNLETPEYNLCGQKAEPEPISQDVINGMAKVLEELKGDKNQKE